MTTTLVTCECCGKETKYAIEQYQYVYNQGETVAIPHTVCEECNQEILIECAPQEMPEPEESECPIYIPEMITILERLGAL